MKMPGFSRIEEVFPMGNDIEGYLSTLVGEGSFLLKASSDDDDDDSGMSFDVAVLRGSWCSLVFPAACVCVRCVFVWVGVEIDGEEQ